MNCTNKSSHRWSSPPAPLVIPTCSPGHPHLLPWSSPPAPLVIPTCSPGHPTCSPGHPHLLPWSSHLLPWSSPPAPLVIPPAPLVSVTFHPLQFSCLNVGTSTSPPLQYVCRQYFQVGWSPSIAHNPVCIQRHIIPVFQAANLLCYMFPIVSLMSPSCGPTFVFTYMYLVCKC